MKSQWETEREAPCIRRWSKVVRVIILSAAGRRIPTTSQITFLVMNISFSLMYTRRREGSYPCDLFSSVTPEAVCC